MKKFKKVSALKNRLRKIVETTSMNIGLEQDPSYNNDNVKETQWNNLADDFKLTIIKKMPDSAFSTSINAAFDKVMRGRDITRSNAIAGSEGIYYLQMSNELRSQGIPNDQIDKVMEIISKVVEKHGGLSGWNPSISEISTTTNGDESKNIKKYTKVQLTSEHFKKKDHLVTEDQNSKDKNQYDKTLNDKLLNSVLGDKKTRKIDKFIDLFKDLVFRCIEPQLVNYGIYNGVKNRVNEAEKNAREAKSVATAKAQQATRLGSTEENSKAAADAQAEALRASELVEKTRAELETIEPSYKDAISKINALYDEDNSIIKLFKMFSGVVGKDSRGIDLKPIDIKTINERVEQLKTIVKNSKRILSGHQEATELYHKGLIYDLYPNDIEESIKTMDGVGQQPDTKYNVDTIKDTDNDKLYKSREYIKAVVITKNDIKNSEQDNTGKYTTDGIKGIIKKLLDQVIVPPDTSGDNSSEASNISKDILDKSMAKDLSNVTGSSADEIKAKAAAKIENDKKYREKQIEGGKANFSKNINDKIDSNLKNIIEYVNKNAVAIICGTIAEPMIAYVIKDDSGTRSQRIMLIRPINTSSYNEFESFEMSYPSAYNGLQPNMHIHVKSNALPKGGTLNNRIVEIVNHFTSKVGKQGFSVIASNMSNLSGEFENFNGKIEIDKTVNADVGDHIDNNSEFAKKVRLAMWQQSKYIDLPLSPVELKILSGLSESSKINVSQYVSEFQPDIEKFYSNTTFDINNKLKSYKDINIADKNTRSSGIKIDVTKIINKVINTVYNKDTAIATSKHDTNKSKISHSYAFLKTLFSSMDSDRDAIIQNFKDGIDNGSINRIKSNILNSGKLREISAHTHESIVPEIIKKLGQISIEINTEYDNIAKQSRDLVLNKRENVENFIEKTKIDIANGFAKYNLFDGNANSIAETLGTGKIYINKMMPANKQILAKFIDNACSIMYKSITKNNGFAIDAFNNMLSTITNDAIAHLNAEKDKITSQIEELNDKAVSFDVGSDDHTKTLEQIEKLGNKSRLIESLINKVSELSGVISSYVNPPEYMIDTINSDSDLDNSENTPRRATKTDGKRKLEKLNQGVEPDVTNDSKRSHTDTSATSMVQNIINKYKNKVKAIASEIFKIQNGAELDCIAIAMIISFTNRTIGQINKKALAESGNTSNTEKLDQKYKVVRTEIDSTCSKYLNSVISILNANPMISKVPDTEIKNFEDIESGVMGGLRAKVLNAQRRDISEELNELLKKRELLKKSNNNDEIEKNELSIKRIEGIISDAKNAEARIDELDKTKTLHESFLKIRKEVVTNINNFIGSFVNIVKRHSPNLAINIGDILEIIGNGLNIKLKPIKEKSMENMNGNSEYKVYIANEEQPVADTAKTTSSQPVENIQDQPKINESSMWHDGSVIEYIAMSL